MSTALKSWRDQGLGEKERYSLYLCSREWGEKRRSVRERCGGLCERCKAAPMSHVHHLTYARKYDERLDDLAGFCEPCHAFTHGLRADDPMLVAREDGPTTAEACDLMSACVSVLNYMLSSSCDLKYNVFALGGPCEKYPELGPTEFSVVIYIRDPETYACGNTQARPGDDSRTIQIRIAELVAEIDEQNEDRPRGASWRDLATEACRLSNLCNREVNRVRKERPDVDIWGNSEVDWLHHAENRVDFIFHAGSVGDLSDMADGICWHGATEEEIRAEIARVVERHDAYVAEAKEAAP